MRLWVWVGVVGLVLGGLVASGCGDEEESGPSGEFEQGAEPKAKNGEDCTFDTDCESSLRCISTEPGAERGEGEWLCRYDCDLVDGRLTCENGRVCADHGRWCI